MDAEAGHYFVEDQQRAVLPGDFAQALQEAFRRRDDAHVAGHRLDDHGSDFFGVPGEQGADALQVVVTRHQGILHGGRRHARRIGQPQRGDARTGLHQQQVGVAVVAAFEFDDFVPFGVGARQPQRGHGGFGAAVDEAHHLDVGHEVAHQFGQFDLQRRGRAVRGAQRGGLAQRFNHGRVGMAEDERPPREDVVHEAVAVHVVEVGPFAAGDEERLAAHGAEGAHR